MSKAVGTFSLVLHSHLPYYRKAGMWPFGEENLYEAMAETYLPLLVAIDELLAEGVQAKLTIGVTPVLAEQLADEHLKQGFETYCRDIITRLEQDVHRYSPEGEREAAVWRAGELRAQKLEAARAAWRERQAEQLQAAVGEPGSPGDAEPQPAAGPSEAASGVARVEPAPSVEQGRAPARPEATRAATTVAGVPTASIATAQPAEAGPVASASGPASAEVLVATTSQALAEAEARASAPETLEPLVGLEDDPEPVLEDIPEESLALPNAPDPRRELSRWYLAWYTARLADFQGRYQRDLLGAFRRLQEAGAIELITCAATHGFSPLFSRDSTLNAQFAVGVETHKRHFGQAPKGVWLPECAYRPGYEDGAEYRPSIDKFLHAHGLQYFFTDAHAVVGGKTSGYRRHIGLYGNIEYLEMPERPLSGLDTFHGYWLPEHPVAFYARNERAGWQVWSADMGYPGDPHYREFHKKDGNSGMPYWRITGPRCELEHKWFYHPESAAGRVEEHADHYVALIHDMLKGYHDANGEPGHVIVPFDTELFGHWWFEGIDWIKHVVRKMAGQLAIARVTVGELHEQAPPAHAFQLPESTWGAGGHYHVWLNPQVEWMWPVIHRCERRMEELVRMCAASDDALHQRALRQAAREVLLLEGSDWPFLVTTGQAKTYAIERFNEHVERFDALADALMAGTTTEDLVAGYEAIDNLFPAIDPGLFAARQERVGQTS
ncbi:MAG: 1,4-alpha-glucan branching protein domain-containing protein [Candidatus Sericytochromatia bacterium]|nr:1,4-alpha-glucan branching protein domain-containing protein [Candidatus Sericytochromatia bacterium]